METTYIFRLAVEGANAVKQAQQYRAQMQQALSGVQLPAANLTHINTQLKQTQASVKSLGGTTSMWGAFNQGVDEATKGVWGLRRAASGIEDLGRSIVRTSMAEAAVIGASVAAYVSYNEAVTRAGMAMNLTSELQDKLTEKVLQTSIALGKFDPSDVAAGMRYWAEGMGEVVTSEAQLDRMLADTASIQKMAAINSLDLADAVTFVGSAMKEFNLSVKDTEMVTEIMNYVAATTFARVSDIGQAFKLVGPVANSMGIQFSEVAAALALVSDQNIKGTMAGRAMRQMFIQMLKPTADYNKTMNTMLGISEDMGEAWKNIVFPGGQFVGLANYIDILAESVEGLTSQERNERLAMLATANELPALASLVNQQIKARKDGINVLSAYQKVMTGVVDSEVIEYKRLYEAQTGLPFSLEGAHAKMTGMWDKYEKSDAFRVQQMQRRWQTLFIQIGDAATKYLLPQVEAASLAIAKVGQTLQDNPALVGQAIEMIKWSLGIGAVVQGLGFLTKSLTNIIVLGAGVREVTKWLKESALIAPAVAAKLTPATLVGPAITGVGAAAAGTLNYTMSQVNPQIIRSISGATVSIIWPQLVTAMQEAWTSNPAWRLGIRLATPKMFFGVPETGIYEDFRQSIQPFFNSAADWIVEGWQKIRDIWVESSGQAVTGAKLPTPVYDQYLEEQKRVAAGGKRLGAREAAEYTTFLNEQAVAKQNADLEALYDDRRKIEQKAKDQRTDILKDEVRDAGQAAQDYRDARMKAFEAYELSGRRTTEDRAEADRKSQEDFNRQELQAAQEHNRDMRNLAISHHDRMIDLAEEGDVRGLIKEMRSYKLQKSQNQDSYKDQSKQRQEAFARQQAEENAARQKEDARRREDYLRQEDDAADSYAKQNQSRRDALAERLSDLQIALPKELAEWDKTHAAEIQKMEDALKTEDTLQREAATKFDMWRMERATRGAWYAPQPIPETELPPHAPGMGPQAGTGMPVGGTETPPWLPNPNAGLPASRFEGKQFAAGMPWFEEPLINFENTLGKIGQTGQVLMDAFLELPGTGKVLRGVLARLLAGETVGQSLGFQPRQEGGYASYGKYLLGERGKEFVVDAPTTRILEDRWGRLSQPLFKATSGEGGGFFPLIVNASFSGMGAADRGWYLTAAREQAEAVLEKATRAARKAAK